ncbi:MAG: Ryanodine receptor Ryr [Bacteroidales bacterium]|nr:Ryanodine receptor Ryr [Bacteroidales bacterium]
MRKDYIPQPINVEDVLLPEELEPLMEVIARNVHEVWAKNRIDQGWVYGSERSDSLRQHPCLIPYEELSEQEKDYDRDTAKNAIKLMYKMGFRIIKGIDDKHNQQ